MKRPPVECYVKIAAVTPRNTTNKTPCAWRACEFKALDKLDYCAYHMREVMRVTANIESNKRRIIMAYGGKKKPIKAGKDGKGK